MNPPQTKLFHDHFSDIASRYANFRPRYPAELFDYLATLVPRNSIVWDCAAGNGQASVDLAARFAKVLATDASQEQIASATPHPRVEYRVATAEQNGLADRSVTLITVAQALHWLNLNRFWTEVNRVLTPEGVIAVWAYGIIEVENDSVNKLAMEFYQNTVGPYWPSERKLVEEGYRTIPFPFEEIESRPFRMETHWTFHQLLGYFSTWSATNRFIKATGINPLESLGAALAAVWGDPNHPRLIAWPLSVRVGRKSGDS